MQVKLKKLDRRQASLVSLTSAASIVLTDNNSIPSADLTTLTTALPGVVTELAGCL